MKRTLKRELKVREIAKRETFGTCVALWKSAVWATGRCTFQRAGQHQFAGCDRIAAEGSCLQCYSPGSYHGSD